MKDTLRKDDFNPLWSALRQPGSGWVSELLAGYLARSSRVKAQAKRNLKSAQGGVAGCRRTTFQGRPPQPGVCACCAAANCS
jgi:hypothetical protein